MSESLKRTAEETQLDGVPDTKKVRLPKRKVALKIGYCGTGYHGMQLNPPHKTIEGDIFEALVKAGAISEDNANDPKKSSFLRAARTDKGVHAAGNVVSLKMIIEDPDIVAKVNQHLPEQIRLWGFTRTNRGFDCRRACSSRIYEYILPTYTLINPSNLTPLGQVLRKETNRLPENPETEEQKELVEECNKFWSAVTKELIEMGISEEQAIQARKDETARKEDPENHNEPSDIIKKLKTVENKHRRSYRISSLRLDKFREVLKQYEGVNNFHNFTVGKPFKDPSAVRIMKTLTVSDPFVIDGTEWCSVKIHGQSFMLHQIRKMIALAVLVVRTNSPISKVKGLYEAAKNPIPKAPALGLLLERPVYSAYNDRLGRLGHEAITFDKYEKEIDEFKHKYIYDRIYQQEAQENDFHAFFGYMDSYRMQGILNYLLDTESNLGEPEPEKESDNEGQESE